MHYDIAEVYQNPFAGILAFNRNDFAAGFLDPVSDMMSQCPGLSVGSSADQHNPVEQISQLGCVEDFYFLTLDVFERVNDQTLQFSKFQVGLFLIECGKFCVD